MIEPAGYIVESLVRRMFLIQKDDLLYGRQGRMMDQHEESKTIVLEQAPDYFNELSDRP